MANTILGLDMVDAFTNSETWSEKMKGDINKNDKHMVVLSYYHIDMVFMPMPHILCMTLYLYDPHTLFKKKVWEETDD